MIGNWLGHLGTIIALLVIVWSCLKTLQVNASAGNVQIWLQLTTYYARFWVLWLLVWANVQLVFNNQAMYWLLIALSLLYLYMTWIEPNRLRVSRHQIALTVPAAISAPASTSLLKHSAHKASAPKANAQLAVLSDIHVGIFSNKKQLERLVKCLNQLPVDAVIILGDWVYHTGADLVGQMMILKALNKPCYTVFSQSDNDQSKAYSHRSDCNPQNEQLSYVLSSLGIERLPETGVTIAGVKVMGVSDGVTADLPHLIRQYTGAGCPLLIATHDIKQLEANPKTLQAAHANTLVVAGQTHGGQVNIPMLTPLMVKALSGNKLVAGLRKPNNRALAAQALAAKDSVQETLHQRYQVWINTGIGMTGLPFRLHCPPTIDVLDITINADL